MGKKIIPPSPVANFYAENGKVKIEKLVAYIEPIQDLHGQTAPYPAGGGKNKFNGTFLQGYWAYANGAFSSDTKWICTEKIPCNPSTYYTTSSDEKMTRWQGFVWFDSNGTFISTSNEQVNANIGLTKQSPSNAAFMAFNIAGYPNTSSTISPSSVTHFQIEEGQQATGFAPYENICPIFGHDDLDIYQSGEDTSDPTTTTIDFPSEIGTIFGGMIDVISGKLRSTKGNIPSYNGETLPNTWISSMEAYAAGATPTIGAQVVYDLAYPTEYQLTPTQISVLLGENNIWSDAGNVSLEYDDGGNLVIKLNNEEMTSYFTPRGMKVSYIKVQGENGGVYLSGDREEDVLAWKAVVTLVCMPLTPDRQSAVLQKVTSDNPSLYYFDPRVNAYRTIHYMASLEETVHRGKGGTGLEFWTGLVLTAEEKSEFAIVEQPEDATGAVGETAYFSVVVTGSGLTFRWQYYKENTSSWDYVTSSAYSGLRTPTMGVPITAARDGYRYRCEIKDGNETRYSDDATLTVETE